MTTSDIVTHLAHSGRLKRRLRWCFCTTHLPHCTCDLSVTIISKQVLVGPDKRSLLISRFDGNYRRSDIEMMKIALIDIARKFSRVGDHFVYRQEDERPDPCFSANLILSLDKSPNQLWLPTIFTTNVFPASQDLPIQHPMIPIWFRRWDLYMFKNYYGINDPSLVVQAFQPCSLPGVLLNGFEKSKNLQIEVIKQLSISNIVYGYRRINGRREYNTYYATNNLYPTKVVTNYEKFYVSPHVPVTSRDILHRLIDKALKMQYMLLGTSHLLGTKKFVFDANQMITDDTIPKDTASGKFAPYHKEKVVDGVRYRVVSNGKKGYLLDRSINKLQQNFLNVVKGSVPKFQRPLINVCPKGEVLQRISESNVDDFLAKNNKFRDFFIENIDGYLQSYCCNHFRQKAERSNATHTSPIQIGLNFYKGGAYRIAKHMRFRKDMRYITGDFKRLDVSIKSFFLALYTSESLRYVSQEETSEVMMRFLKMLVAHRVDCLTSKVVNMFMNIWRLVIGMMPSGAYETSHGDSWIVLLYACLALAYQIVAHPDGSDLERAFVAGKIRIIVYGDDFIIGVPKLLSHIFNAEIFARICSLWGATLRDLKDMSSFLSVPDVKRGTIIVPGCVFLKRYFIDSKYVTDGQNLPAVVPFRPIATAVHKMAFGSSSRTLSDMIAVTVSMGYESFGTNMCLYHLACYMNQQVTKAMKETDWRQAFAGYAGVKNNDLNKMARKFPHVDDFYTFPAVTKLHKMLGGDGTECYKSEINSSMYH